MWLDLVTNSNKIKLYRTNQIEMFSHISTIILVLQTYQNRHSELGVSSKTPEMQVDGCPIDATTSYTISAWATVTR